MTEHEPTKNGKKSEDTRFNRATPGGLAVLQVRATRQRWCSTNWRTMAAGKSSEID